MTTMRSNRSDFLLKRIILGIPKVLNNKLLGLLLLCNLIMASGCSIDSTPSTNAPTDLHASTPASNSDANVIQPIPTKEKLTIVSTPLPLDDTNSPRGEIKGTVIAAAAAIPANQEVHREIVDGIIELGPGLAYSRLLRFKSGSNVNLPSMIVECELCVSWENPDPLTYIFQLRDDVKWQESDPLLGRKLIASDVEFSLNRVRNTGWAAASLLQSIDSVEAKGDDSVIIHLAYRDSDFLIQLANGINRIIAPEAVLPDGDLSNGPTVGSGPWSMDTYKKGSIKLERNMDYFEGGVPGLESLQIMAIPSSETRIAAILTGRVDLVPLDVDGYGQLKDNNANLTIRHFPEQGTGSVVVFNTRRPPFDQVALRRAVLYGIDPWKAINNVSYGIGDVSMGIPVLDFDWLLSRDRMERYLGNRIKSKQLLADHAESGAVPFTLKVADYGDMYLNLANEYKEMLDEVGFSVDVETLNPRSYVEDLWQGDEFQAFFGPVTPADNPNAYLFGLLHSEGRWNVTGNADVNLDELIEDQATTLIDRKQKLLDIQEHVIDKALMFMPVTGARIWASNGRVSDFHPNVVGGEYFYWARLKDAGQLR